MKDPKKRSGDFESSYTEDIGREICVRVAFGQSMRFICSMNHMPSYWCLCKWLYGPVSEESEHGQSISAFRLAYGEALAAQRELLADEMIPIADEAFDRDSAAAAKIKLQAREFKLERLDPKRWAAATRSIERETVEDFANKMVEALEVIQKRKAERLGSASTALESRGHCEEESLNGQAIDVAPNVHDDMPQEVESGDN